jgi:uncharacterized membrane protein
MLESPEVAHCRPFAIADAMILVAATAPPLYFLKLYYWPLFEVQYYACVCLASAFAISWSFAWLILRHRRPRPSRRRLVRQPGMAAGLAATVAMASVICWVITANLRAGDEIFAWNLPLRVSVYNYFAVLVVWIVLAYGGLFRREPGWIDASGMALGGFWLVKGLTDYAYFFYFQ